MRKLPSSIASAVSTDECEKNELLLRAFDQGQYFIIDELRLMLAAGWVPDVHSLHRFCDEMMKRAPRAIEVE